MRRLRLASLLLLPCLALVSGCGEAVTFNDSMIELTQDLEKAGRKFGERVTQNEGRRDQLEEAYNDAVGEVGKIMKRAKAIRVPKKVKGARAYHEAFMAYMEFEENAANHEFRKIVSAAARGDRESLWTNLQRMGKQEQEEIAKMKAAQKAFAEANGLAVRE
jgi:hypothetical protein